MDWNGLTITYQTRADSPYMDTVVLGAYIDPDAVAALADRYSRISGYHPRIVHVAMLEFIRAFPGPVDHALGALDRALKGWNV